MPATSVVQHTLDLLMTSWKIMNLLHPSQFFIFLFFPPHWHKLNKVLFFSVSSVHISSHTPLIFHLTHSITRRNCSFSILLNGCAVHIRLWATVALCVIQLKLQIFDSILLNNLKFQNSLEGIQVTWTTIIIIINLNLDKTIF